MDDLIAGYDCRWVEAGCAPGSGRYGLHVEVPGDISPAFPYLNAVLVGARYHHQSRILIWREKDRVYALRPHEIKIVQAEGISDQAQADRLVIEIVERINNAWRNRGEIAPCLVDRSPAPVFEIFGLLPKTNCKQCGYPTCLAYAAGLREEKIQLETCPALLRPEFAGNRRKLEGIL